MPTPSTRAPRLHARTAADVVLFVAASRNRGPEIHLSSLILDVWESDRPRFGLQHYADYHPDTARIVCEVVRLKRAGLLARVRPRVYALTPAGLARLAKLREES